jgi:hypothetical protein
MSHSHISIDISIYFDRSWVTLLPQGTSPARVGSPREFHPHAPRIRLISESGPHDRGGLDDLECGYASDVERQAQLHVFRRPEPLSRLEGEPICADVEGHPGPVVRVKAGETRIAAYAAAVARTSRCHAEMAWQPTECISSHDQLIG